MHLARTSVKRKILNWKRRSLLSQRVSDSYVSFDFQFIYNTEQGYLQSYVDFFYITTDTTPSEIQPSIKLKEEQRLNKRAGKTRFEQTQDSLLALSDNLK